MNPGQRKELIALVKWLQTFPSFVTAGSRVLEILSPASDDVSSCSTSDVDKIVHALGALDTSRSILNIAEEVCKSDSANTKANHSFETSEQIWTSLLILTSTRARPLPKDEEEDDDDERSQSSSNGGLSTGRLKLYVLSNLLDCAVQFPNLQQRRGYIERIMKLHKSTQKTLMSLIERRDQQHGLKRFQGRSSSSSASKSHAASSSSSVGSGASRRKRTPSRPPPMIRNSSSDRNNSGMASSRRNHRNQRSLSPHTRSSSADASNCIRSRSTPPEGMAKSHMDATDSTQQTPPQPPLAQTLSASSSGEVEEITRLVIRGVVPRSRPWEEPAPMKTSSSSSTVGVSNTSLSKSKQQQPKSTASSASIPNSSTKQTVDTSRSARSHSVAFPATPSGYTPELKRSLQQTPMNHHTRSSSPTMLWSPGVMDSPMQMQTMMQALKSQNEAYEQEIASFQQKEQYIQQKVDEMEALHRTRCVKLESEMRDREQDLQRHFEERMESLTRDLEETRRRSAKGDVAVQELQQVRDELDLLRHNQSSLTDMSEKLRLYKDKVTELQDAKEALQREQEAHSKAVDDIVQLEQELAVLKPLKRQLEDYKFRAIEAEVKLVECQDYLRRTEQQATDQSVANDILWKGALMQKEQLEELQRRILEETKPKSGSFSAGQGVGAGITELNPELKEELTRLRNENFQLRAFAAKRQDDATQKLEESLEDSTRLAERYKQEYLNTKQNLGRTQSQLAEQQQKCKALGDERDDWKERTENSEKRLSDVGDRLYRCDEELAHAKHLLSESNKVSENLRRDLQVWMRKKDEAEEVSEEYINRFKRASDELDKAKHSLEDLKQQKKSLEGSLSSLKLELEDEAARREEVEEELGEAQTALAESRATLVETERKVANLDTQIKRLQEERSKLEKFLEEERQSKTEAIEEAHRSLEVTREILRVKAQKDMEELQSNMNRLLEDERRASRLKHEEGERKLHDVEAKWRRDYNELQEHSTSTLKRSRQEAQNRIELLKQEHLADVAKTKREAEQARDNLIQRGKAMIHEAKAKAREELQLIHDECKDLETKLNTSEKEKQELDTVLRGKIASLKHKLDLSIGQVQNMTAEIDDLNEKIKCSEREKLKLQEDNDRYRRQLGGRFGADGNLQSQMEKLQKEYMDVLEENRQLKRHSENNGLEVVMESFPSNGGGMNSLYSRGGVSDSTLTQLRLEYEEKIESLTDEKRELVMRNSMAVTDVQKAENRAWQREQEIADLKSEITSLKLAVSRSENHSDQSIDYGCGLLADSLTQSFAPRELPFQSSQQDRIASIPRLFSSSPPSTTVFDRSSGSTGSTGSRSPAIERAKREKEEHENQLRNRLSALSGINFSQPRLPRPLPTLDTSGTSDPTNGGSMETGLVLTPTRKHEHVANQFDKAFSFRTSASDIFGLGLAESTMAKSSSPFVKSSSSTSQQQQEASSASTFSALEKTFFNQRSTSSALTQASQQAQQSFMDFTRFDRCTAADGSTWPGNSLNDED